jgi:hypothetical protein
MGTDLAVGTTRGTSLVDLLDRVLDKGLVIAGDIKVSIADVELLTIRIRLLICSLDKAKEIGLEWWKYDQDFSPRQLPTLESRDLRRQVRLLERKVASLTAARTPLFSRLRRTNGDKKRGVADDR